MFHHADLTGRLKLEALGPPTFHSLKKGAGFAREGGCLS